MKLCTVMAVSPDLVFNSRAFALWTCYTQGTVSLTGNT